MFTFINFRFAYVPLNLFRYSIDENLSISHFFSQAFQIIQIKNGYYTFRLTPFSKNPFFVFPGFKNYPVSFLKFMSL